MNYREAELWLYGMTDTVGRGIVDAGERAKNTWENAGASSAQVGAAQDAACEVQIIAAMWPETPDEALRPGRVVIGWRIARRAYRKALVKCFSG